MKKLLLLAAVAAFGLSNVNAQETTFGVTAGFLNVSAKVEFGGDSASASESGFYVGGLVDIAISEEFHIQPELLYANVNEGSALMLPIIAKYYVAEGFNVQAGPQVTFSLEETVDDFSSIDFGLGIGAGYDIDENFFVEARYTFQVNNSYTGNADIEARANYLNIGLGYKF